MSDKSVWREREEQKDKQRRRKETDKKINNKKYKLEKLIN